MQRPQIKKVSVAIVTANRSEMLKVCLESLRKSDYPVHEILVLDNASTDDTAAMVEANYPSARLITNARNMGLSYCHNQAMQAFTGDCLFLLDDDNETAPDMLRLLVEHLYAPEHHDVGIVVPVIYDYYGTHENVVTAGGCTSMWSGRNQLNDKNIDMAKEFYDSRRASNSTLIRREVIEQVGCMDDSLFSTLADEDYVRRMNAAGRRCHVVLAAAIYHKQKPSSTYARRIGITNPARAYILARNRTVLITRYAKWYQLLTYFIFWHHVFNAFYLYVLIFKMRSWPFVRAYLKGLVHAWSYVFTKRLPPLSCVLEMVDQGRARSG